MPENDTERGPAANAYRSGRRYRIVRNGNGWRMEPPNDDNVRKISIAQAGPSYTAMDYERFVAYDYAEPEARQKLLREHGSFEGPATVRCPICGAMPVPKEQQRVPEGTRYYQHDSEAHKKILQAKAS